MKHYPFAARFAWKCTLGVGGVVFSYPLLSWLIYLHHPWHFVSSEYQSYRSLPLLPIMLSQYRVSGSVLDYAFHKRPLQGHDVYCFVVTPLSLTYSTKHCWPVERHGNGRGTKSLKKSNSIALFTRVFTSTCWKWCDGPCRDRWIKPNYKVMPLSWSSSTSHHPEFALISFTLPYHK